MTHPAPAAMTAHRRSAQPHSRKLIFCGLLIALLLLNIGAVSAAANVTLANRTIAAPAEPITVLPTGLLEETPLTTAVPTTMESIDPVSILSTSETISADSYTARVAASRNGGPIPQEEKEAAAANYREIRERFLMTGSLAPAAPAGRDLEGAGYNGTAGPVMDPGGIPHYFGPYPNWANSPMPMGSIANITVDDPGRFYLAGAPPNVTIADAYFTGSGATANCPCRRGCHQQHHGHQPRYELYRADRDHFRVPAPVLLQPLTSGPRSTAVCASSSTPCRA